MKDGHEYETRFTNDLAQSCPKVNLFRGMPTPKPSGPYVSFSVQLYGDTTCSKNAGNHITNSTIVASIAVGTDNFFLFAAKMWSVLANRE